MGGGNFANGATTAAIQYAFNQLSENSQMTKNKDGHWQTRDNAALEAAGLNPSTSTHSCGPVGNGICAAIGTLTGDGHTDTTQAVDTTLSVSSDVGDILGKSVPWQIKLGTYLYTIPSRFRNNYQACEQTCNKQAFDR